MMTHVCTNVYNDIPFLGVKKLDYFLFMFSHHYKVLLIEGTMNPVTMVRD